MHILVVEDKRRLARLLEDSLELWNALVVLLLVGALEGITYVVLARSFSNAVESELHARMSQKLSIANQVGLSALAQRNAQRLEYDLAYPGVFAPVADMHGRVLAAPVGLRALAVPDQAALDHALTGHVDERTVKRGAYDVRLLSAPVFSGSRVIGAVQVGRSQVLHERELATLLQVALIGGMVALVLCLGGGLFLAGRALVPVRAAFVAQQAFAADASHELRTPLALLRGTAEMLQSRYGRDARRDHPMIADLLSDCDRLRRLVGDLLTLARADAGQMALRSEAVRLDRLVDDAGRRGLVLAAPREIALTWSASEITWVDGDPAWLAQLIWILLDNALSYTNQGGAVRMDLTANGRHVGLAVSDAGIGIPASSLPHIFDRFYRVDSARARESGGAGLGLALARVIAKAHGGTIQAESGEGLGSVFTVYLPVRRDPAGSGEPSATKRSEPR